MITTVTLNASVDKAYHMDRDIGGGEVMRVAECRNSAGGKGLNVARIVKLCGEDVLTTGLAGGFNGAYLESMLKEDGLRCAFQRIAGETRSCINILDPKFGSTEFLEPGCDVTPQEEEIFLTETFPAALRSCAVVTLSGSVTKGMSADIYRRLVETAKALGKAVILDTSGETLTEGLKGLPTMVKPNKEELEALLGETVETEEDCLRAADKLRERGIDYVVVSLGKDGSMMVCPEGAYVARPPKIEAVNTVGCGDSMVAAFAVGMDRNSDSENLLRFASAVATANALSSETGSFRQEDLDSLLSRTEVSKIR